MAIEKDLYKYQNYLFDRYVNISYLLIIISFIGLSSYSTKYLNELNYYIKIYVSLFLLWRFRPFREKSEFTDLDRKIAFTAGLLIITTTFLNNYIDDIKHISYQFFKSV